MLPDPLADRLAAGRLGRGVDPADELAEGRLKFGDPHRVGPGSSSSQFCRLAIEPVQPSCSVRRRRPKSINHSPESISKAADSAAGRGLVSRSVKHNKEALADFTEAGDLARGILKADPHSPIALGG